MFVATTRMFAFAAFVAFVCVGFAAVDDSSIENAQKPVGQILLSSGDYYSGTPVDTEQAGAVAWQTKFATAPFVFPLEKLKSASFPSPNSRVPQRREFCFELHGGQAVFGTLLATTGESLVMESGRFGRLTLDESSIARFYRSHGNRSGLADGLQGLTGWTAEGLPGDWREEAGALVSETQGASITQEIAVPPRFWVEIDAEWTKDFGIEFDFGDVFRIESWNDHVMVARETETSVTWRYTFDQPTGDWQQPDFDDSQWQVGKPGFGGPGEPGLGTVWQTPDIWIRRTVDLPKTKDRPQLRLRHDEDAKVYLNGVLAVEAPNYNTDYAIVEISDEALATLKLTGNVMAVHCHQTVGGQYIDAKFVGANEDEDGDGDIASIKPKEGEGGLHVRCFADRQTGEVKVADLSGKLLTTIQVKPKSPVDNSLETILFRLTSYSSYLRVKQLVVSEWDGKETTFESQDRLRVRLTDGRLIVGDGLSIVEGSNQLVVASGQASKTFPTDQVASVTFGARDYGSPQPYWLNLHDGTVLSGELTGVKRGILHIRSSLAEQDLTIPVGELRSLTNIAASSRKLSDDKKLAGNDSSNVQEDKQNDNDKDREEKESVLLEAEGIVSHGTLMDSTPSEVALGMSWRPSDSLNASPLRRDSRLRIEFRAEAKGPVKEEYPRLAMLRMQGIVLPEASAPEEEKEKGKPAPGLDGGKEYVVLVNGDRLEGHVTKFDETGLWIQCDLISESFIPADQVHTWETNEETWLEDMNEEKRRRLLTLPRKQRESPPTHIVESITNDFLRTRIARADENNIYSIVKLKEHPIPRSLVQRVVWLTPNERKKKETPASSGEPAHAADFFGPGTALTLIDGSLQVTMKLEGIIDGKLVGESALLGRCNVEVDQIAELRLGGTVLRDANALAKWRLQDAIDPIYMQDKELEENDRMTAGLTFPLVGEAAPDFNAPTLAGDPIQLSSLRGRVIVLDFWATWCGPCIQAIPEIVSVVESYDESKVQLISVNMGEDKASMVACLEQLKLSPLVAMDGRGQVASQYLVKSIPQTVVIDPRGKVARVFVGSSSQLEKQLRFAIDELLTE